MDRAKLKKLSSRTEEVALKSGETVTLADFSAAERIGMANDFNKAERAKESEQTAWGQHLMARVIQLCVVDDSGNRIYGPDELEAVQQELSGSLLDELAEHCFRFAGFDVAQADDSEEDQPAKKGSGGKKKGRNSS